MRKLTTAAVAAAFLAAAMPTTAPAHRSGCHSKHVCPSDHATYKWRGKLCVKPTSNKRTSAFKTKVRYAGLTYYCKR
jgi:hypothetical protein